MAAEKLFETKVKKWLHDQGVYAAGEPQEQQTGKATGWFLKTWGGGMQTSGIPDLLICVNGFFIGCELKAPNGKPSDLQIKNIKMINNGNGIGIVLYPEGFEQFKNIIRGLIWCNFHTAVLTALISANINSSCDTLTS